MRLLIAWVFVSFLAVCLHALRAEANWQQQLKELEGDLKNYKDPTFLNQKVLLPATQGDGKLSTTDGSVEFDGSFLCFGERPVLDVSATAASKGELIISFEYDLDGVSKLLTVPNVAGVCSGALVYGCQPAGSWKDCKYGLLEFKKSELVVSPDLPSGEPRPAVGLEGCFCFSDACGNTTREYMPQILSHVGQAVANQIAASRRDLLVTGPEYISGTKARWYSGDPATCNGDEISKLTDQANNLEFNYQPTIQAQEEDSPWDLVTKQLEKTTRQFSCVKRAKVASEWSVVTRIQPTRWGVGWDTDGGSKQCFWFMPDTRSCGYYFGEPNSWNACLDQAAGDRAGVCSSLWVSSGFFTRITDVRNARPVTNKQGLCNWGIDCYGGAGCGDDGQLWEMDCVGQKFSDKFVCYSSNKAEEGEAHINLPYDPTRFEGCDEVRHVENTCLDLERREGCRLLREETDGVLTVHNGVVTTARPIPSCKTIKGTVETRVVCEPWWTKTRTYECEDPVGDLGNERERAAHVGANISMDGNKFVSTIGDLTFKDGVKTQQVIDLNFQFDNSYRSCAPACVVQRQVANYEPIIPSAQGKLEADGSWHVEDQESSVVPPGKRTILNTIDCEFEDDVYRCPIPDGWQMRAQCSCADGDEFLNVISSLTVINEVSKDFICSTGQEFGVCGADEDERALGVICGKFNPVSDKLVEGEDYWLCAPRLWVGKTISRQTHYVELNPAFECEATVEGLHGTTFNLGQVNPQKSWWSSSLQWALGLITEHLNHTPDRYQFGYQCGCAGPEYQVDICQGVENGMYVCLVDNSLYPDHGACSSSCSGFATFNSESGLCVWAEDKSQVVKLGDLQFDYQLGINLEEKHFGEAKIQLIPYDQALIASGLGECIPVSNGFECQTDGRHHQTEVGCRAECLIPSHNIDGCGQDFQLGELVTVNIPGSCSHHSLDPIQNTKTIVNYSGTKYPFMLMSLGYNDYSASDGNGWVKSSLISGQFDVLKLSQEIRNKTGYAEVYTFLQSLNSSGSAIPSYTSVKDIHGNIITSDIAPAYYYYPNGTVRSNVEGTWIFPNGLKIHRKGSTTRVYNCSLLGCGDLRDETTISTAGYVCSADQQAYENEAQCVEACQTEITSCSLDGRLVNSAEECFTDKYSCASNGQSYDTAADCERQCPRDNLISHTSCFSSSEPLTFSLYHSLSSTPYGFDMTLDLADSRGIERIGVIGWGDEHLPLQQCMDRYLQPFIKVDEPGTGAHFEFSQFDLVAYQLSGSKGELPYVNGELPTYPLLYVGSGALKVGSEIPPGYLEEVDDDGKFILVPDPDYDPANESPPKDTNAIPRTPMFLNKKVATPTHTKAGSRAGALSFSVSDLTAYAYYYQCPEGQITTGSSCGQVPPFGGVYDTIAGPRCIQFACDQAEVETTSNQYSGCGLINDGLVRE